MVAEQHIEVNRTGLWVAVITILGGVPRIIGLGTTPLWLDESYTGLCSRMMAADGWAAATACDHISPGYYVLAVISATLFGNFSETTMRLAAALAGLATIPAMAALARRMLNNDRAVVAVALATALAPLLLRYSQEARGYSPLLLLTVCYLILNWDLVQRGPSLWRFAGILGIATGMVWLHTAALYAMVAVGLLMVWQLKLTKRPIWVWAAVHLLAGLSYLPFALATSDDLARLVDNPLPGNPLPRLALNAMAMIAGSSLGPTAQDVGTMGTGAVIVANLPALGLIGVAVVCAVLAGWRLRNQVTSTVWVWLAVLLIVPNLLLVTSVYTSHVLLHVRYVITTWPVYGLLVGLIWANIRRHATALVAGLLLIAVCITSTVNYFVNPKYAREDVTRLPATLAETMKADDVLLIANDNVVVPMLFYGLRCPANTIDMRNEHAFETLRTATAAPGGDTFVILYRQWENTPPEVLNEFLDQTLAPPSQVWRWQGVELQRRPGRLLVGTGPGLDRGCLYDS